MASKKKEIVLYGTEVVYAADVLSLLPARMFQESLVHAKGQLKLQYIPENGLIPFGDKMSVILDDFVLASAIYDDDDSWTISPMQLMEPKSAHLLRWLVDIPAVRDLCPPRITYSSQHDLNLVRGDPVLLNSNILKHPMSFTMTSAKEGELTRLTFKADDILIQVEIEPGKTTQVIPGQWAKDYPVVQYVPIVHQLYYILMSRVGRLDADDHYRVRKYNEDLPESQVGI